jgi:Flp pilus assembly protein TadG
MRNAIKRNEGAAVVEFALLIIPLMVLAFGITEFGRAIYQYDTLTKATRNAVRYLSTRAPGEGFAQANDLAYCGKSPCGTAGPVVPGLTQAMIVVCDSTNSSGSGNPSSGCTDRARGSVDSGSEPINLVTVKIEGFVFAPVVNFTISGQQVGLNGITFDTIASTMRQVL